LEAQIDQDNCKNAAEMMNISFKNLTDVIDSIKEYNKD
jgi:hypothetical protein